VMTLAASRVTNTTTSAFVDHYRAEMLSESALNHVEALLKSIGDSDGFVIWKERAIQAEGVGNAEYLMAAKPRLSDEGWVYEYSPLFSFDGIIENTKFLESQAVEFLGSDLTEMSLEPWMRRPEVSWKYMENSSGENVGRYAFWIDDEQGYLDLAKTGNTSAEGKHKRVSYPQLAPGQPATGEQVGLYVLEQSDVADDDSLDGLEDAVFAGRDRVISKGDLFGEVFENPDFTRDSEGSFSDEGLRALEQNGVYRTVAYDEQPLTPLLPEIHSSFVQKPKLNLNRWLGEEGGLEFMSSWIDQTVPHFAERRKGGFPEDYTKTIVASIIDYADEDLEATWEMGEYRGVDAFPVVSEYLLYFEWLIDESEGFNPEEAKLRVRAFAELWNHTNKPLSGKLQANFETHFSLFAKGLPELAHLSSSRVLDDESKASHNLIKKGEDDYCFPEIGFGGDFDEAVIESGEYRFIELGEVVFSLDPSRVGGKTSRFIDLKGDSYKSSYRFFWNGSMVDQSRGGLTRNNMKLRAKPNKNKQGRLNVAALRHGRWGEYTDNGGDSRMSYYLTNKQWGPAYPDNFSPYRRNVLLNIFDESRLYTRSLMSEWPDGGNDPEFGAQSYLSTDKGVDPLDYRFSDEAPEADELSAPTVLSQRGFYKSVTELGHIYDPVMWDCKVEGRDSERWRDIGNDAIADSRYGGGNTLRIGRPEHSRFIDEKVRASILTDIFHAGAVNDRRAKFIRRESSLNINTATHDALRGLYAGSLRQDPKIALEGKFDRVRMAPKVMPKVLSAPTNLKEADRVAAAIIEARPFSSLSQLSDLKDAEGEFVFGSEGQYGLSQSLQWSDRAREELFARGYDNATIRSRNYKVYVLAQVISKGAGGEVKVLAEDSRSVRMFVDPGLREEDGALIRENVRIKRRELEIK